MRTLEKIAGELEATTKTANMSVDDLPWNTRPAWMTKITAAKDAIKPLEAEYKAQLLRSAVAIFVDGSPEKVKTFAKIVHDEREGVVVDASALYDRLTLGVEATMGHTREWGIGQIHKLHQLLMEVMHDAKLDEIEMPSRASVDRKLPTRQDVYDHIRNIVRAACGDRLNARYLETLAAREALAIRYTHNIVPVVVLHATPDEIQVLGASYAKGFAPAPIRDDEEVTKELMVKVFRDVNKKVRAKK